MYVHMIEEIYGAKLLNEENRDLYISLDVIIDALIKVQFDVVSCVDKLDKREMYAMILKETLGDDYKTIGELLEGTKDLIKNTEVQ